MFPPADQLWAWAHVHVNADLIRSDGVVTLSRRGHRRLPARGRDRAERRPGLLPGPLPAGSRPGDRLPRVPDAQLRERAARRARPRPGRGGPTAPNPARFATQSAWETYTDRPVGGVYPYYTRWCFRTGSVGDFEYLVRLLQPRPPDSRLGRRDMDVQRPGSDLTGIEIPALDGVLRLGGALQVPAEALTDEQEAEATAYEEWDTPFPHPFQTDLAAFVNLADDYQRSGDPDPLITPPLYGRWHALSERILDDADGDPLAPTDNWLHEVNLDPRFRVAAGFGTQVLEKNQEAYMDAAWGQVGDVLAANRRIRLATVAQAATTVWWSTHLKPLRDLSAERSLMVTAPMHRRVVSQGIVVRHQFAVSTVPTALLSPAVRRVLRPRDHVAGRLGFGTPVGPENLIDRVNDGEVSAAPPRVTPPGPADRRGGGGRAGQAAHARAARAADRPAPPLPLAGVGAARGGAAGRRCSLLLLVPGPSGWILAARDRRRRRRRGPLAAPRRPSDRRCPTSCCRAAAPRT